MYCSVGFVAAANLSLVPQYELEEDVEEAEEGEEEDVEQQPQKPQQQQQQPQLPRQHNSPDYVHFQVVKIRPENSSYGGHVIIDRQRTVMYQQGAVHSRVPVVPALSHPQQHTSVTGLNQVTLTPHFISVFIYFLIFFTEFSRVVVTSHAVLSSTLCFAWYQINHITERQQR